MADGAPGDGHGPHDLLGGGGQLLDPGPEHPAQATVDRPTGDGARGELLGEEGVALGSSGDLADGPLVESPAPRRG